MAEATSGAMTDAKASAIEVCSLGAAAELAKRESALPSSEDLEIVPMRS